MVRKHAGHSPNATSPRSPSSPKSPRHLTADGVPEKRESASFKTKWAEFESKLRQLASSAETDVDQRDDSDIERSRRKWGWLITLFAALAMVSGIVFAPPEVKVQIDQSLADIKTNLDATFASVINATETALIGRVLYEEGHRFKHPVLIVPGFTTTGLELWHSADGCNGQFRSRVWGSGQMAANILKAMDCWMMHLKLDAKTGLDPPSGAKGAADFAEFYYVWSRILENMAMVGYDSSNTVIMGYDWRLSADLMETRDGFLSLMKARVENLIRRHGEKVVVMTHSYGSNVFFYFLKWVESENGGRGGKGWVEKHIHAWNNIAGALLGIPKATTALLSGEMKDTAQLGFFNDILEYTRSLHRDRRAELFRTWGSLWAMLPKGGNYLHGDAKGAPDDSYLQTVAGAANASYGYLFQHFRRRVTFKNITASKYSEFLSGIGGSIPDRLKGFSFGYAKDPAAGGHEDAVFWHNPLESTLPDAPSMSINCLLGAGKPTERAYAYKKTTQEDMREEVTDNVSQTVPYILDWGQNANGWVSGVLFSEGDGTVPAISSGYMCVKGWKSRTHNPAAIEVVTREYPHDPMTFAIRGGSTSADHVDIMGNSDMIADLIVSACGGSVEPRIHSNITEYADKIYRRRYADEAAGH